MMIINCSPTIIKFVRILPNFGEFWRKVLLPHQLPLAYNNFVHLLTGSLAKLVYFTKNDDHIVDGEERISPEKALGKSNGSRNCPVLNGRLNFKKFETSKINDCLEFIKTMKLHLGGMYRIVFLCFNNSWCCLSLCNQIFWGLQPCSWLAIFNSLSLDQLECWMSLTSHWGSCTLCCIDPKIF